MTVNGSLQLDFIQYIASSKILSIPVTVSIFSDSLGKYSPASVCVGCWS